MGPEYEIRLRRLVGGRLTVNLTREGHLIAQAELQSRVSETQPFDIGELFLDIPLDEV